MSGICGEVQLTDAPARLEAVGAMGDRLSRRGPDAQGAFLHDRVALGHHRLKVLDLSARSDQPMIDSELGLGIVLHGSIYNVAELREALRQKGYRFFSDGDAEVVLKAYHADGGDFVEKLHGVFALALWERDSGRVVLARDRLGVRPLYYSESEGVLRFASTLPALLAAGGVDTRIDPVALHFYMTFHAVVPAPRTILRGVRKLPPAHVMTIEPDGQHATRQYWAAHFDPHAGDQEVGFEQWQDRVLASVDQAVQRRMVGDVPVGVLLSGGLDSSLVVGLLARAGVRNIQTFSIGFEAVGEEKGDEFEYSDLIARHFGTEHQRIFVDSSRALPAMAGCVAAMSEPMVSHDAIGFYLLSQEVAKHVKVVQSGQGADEVFAGYHWYPPLLESSDPLGDYARGFFDRDHGGFLEAVHPELVAEDYSRAFVAGHFGAPGATRGIDKALRLDTTVMAVEDPVKRVDNMTMASGLEARMPFLDHEVVELAGRIPAEFKAGGGGKYVLKEAARRVIPAGVIDRPKGYFPVPALKYVKGAYLDWMRDILERPAARQRGIFRPAYVQKLLSAPQDHITPLRGSMLWQVALLEYWFQQQGI